MARGRCGALGRGGGMLCQGMKTEGEREMLKVDTEGLRGKSGAGRRWRRWIRRKKRRRRIRRRRRRRRRKRRNGGGRRKRRKEGGRK